MQEYCIETILSIAEARRFSDGLVATTFAPKGHPHPQWGTHLDRVALTYAFIAANPLPSITLHEMNNLSVHAPVTAHLTFLPDDMTIIPLALSPNDYGRSRVRDTYCSTISEVIKQLDSTRYGPTLERAANKLIQETVTTWIAVSPIKTMWFGPGLIRKRDGFAKNLSRLLKSDTPETRS